MGGLLALIGSCCRLPFLQALLDSLARDLVLALVNALALVRFVVLGSTLEFIRALAAEALIRALCSSLWLVSKCEIGGSSCGTVGELGALSVRSWMVDIGGGVTEDRGCVVDGEMDWAKANN